MPKIYQAFNGKNNAWTKYKKLSNGKTVITDVKQSNPQVPFKGVTIKGRKK